MGPSQDEIDALYRERVQRARAMSPGDKLLAGPRLFDLAAEWTKAGIRAQHPGATEEEVMAIFLDRLALRRRLEGR